MEEAITKQLTDWLTHRLNSRLTEHLFQIFTASETEYRFMPKFMDVQIRKIVILVCGGGIEYCDNLIGS